MPDGKNNCGKKEKLFVTGVAGFFGSHVADAFKSSGHPVAGYDNLIGGYKDNVPESAEYYEVDLTDFVTLCQVMRGIHIVYHCAATAYEGLSVFSPRLVSHHGFDASTQHFLLQYGMALVGLHVVPPWHDMVLRKCLL